MVVVDKIARLTQKHFERAVLPFVVYNPGLLRELLVEKNTMFTQLEVKSNTLLHKIIDGNLLLIYG